MKVPDLSGCTAIVLAPMGRDAAVAVTLLMQSDIDAVACADLSQFCAGLGEQTSCAIVTEEALRSADLRSLSAWVASQPAWSDLPFIVVTQRGGGPERNPGAARLAQTLGNVTFLERPFHPTTLTSVVRSAVRGRYRQLEARVRMEELHEGEERLRTALTAGQLGAWELDLATSTLVASDQFKEIFGRCPNDLFNYAQLTESVHPDDQVRVQAAVRSSTETGCDYSIEHRNLWPDGSIHWVELRARLVRDRHGKNAKLVGVSSDITARKAAESDLVRTNETLEARVSERTSELERAHATVLEEIKQRERTEDLLRQVQKMEMIGQLTGGVAHDFNNLLMAVLSNLELLRRHESDDPKKSRLIEGAIRGAERGAALTQRLLAFARQQDLKVKPVNLAELIRGMSDLIERSVGAQIELSVMLPEELPLTLADANQVELALLNLIINARDAMPIGGALSITADTGESTGNCELAAGKYVRVSVRDTGHGMDPEILKKAVEPFFTTKEVGKGTGLGLSMIHGLALQLGGSLRLESGIGRGTTAVLWLPITEAVPMTETFATAPTVERTATDRCARILVVDDDMLVASSTSFLLEDLGHQVIEADSGAQALEILMNGTAVDLVITDYSMPKMTGIELAKAAREIQPELPFLLATGYADLPPGSDLDIPRLQKPYQQDQLLAEIAKALDGKCRSER